MTPQLSFDPRTVTPEWVRQAVLLYAVPKRFTLRVAGWAEAKFQIRIPQTDKPKKAIRQRERYARNVALGLTCQGRTRRNRVHPELRGLDRSDYKLAWKKKRRAEAKLFARMQRTYEPVNCRTGLWH